MSILLLILSIFILYLYLAHFLSYSILKKRTLKSKKWDLNICCGKTDGGGINADIAKHKDLPNFILIKDIYKLPFKDKQFNYVLCSHAIEHVDSPVRFYKELKRVGKHVVLVVPPLWDIFASFFAFPSHRWICLTLKKEHTTLPKMISYSLAIAYQNLFGQHIGA